VKIKALQDKEVDLDIDIQDEEIDKVINTGNRLDLNVFFCLI